MTRRGVGMIWIATAIGFVVGVFTGILAMGLFQMVSKRGSEHDGMVKL